MSPHSSEIVLVSMTYAGELGTALAAALCEP